MTLFYNKCIPQEKALIENLQLRIMKQSQPPYTPLDSPSIDSKKNTPETESKGFLQIFSSSHTKKGEVKEVEKRCDRQKWMIDSHLCEKCEGT